MQNHFKECFLFGLVMGMVFGSLVYLLLEW